MSNVILGNHSSVLVPRKDRADINQFYVKVLGGKLMQADPDRDFICLGDNFFMAFLYGEVEDAGELHRNARALWLELKSDNVVETRLQILNSGLVRQLDIPDPHLYFQAPGGQCLRLVGIDEDLSFYEGTGTGPDMEKIKAALQNNISHNFTATIMVSQSPEDVFNRITNDVAKWWGGKDFTGSSEKLNDEFIVRHGAHYSKQQLVEVIPNKKVVWLVTESKLDWLQKDQQEWENTRMIFEISTKGNETVLHFTHEGLVPEKECYVMCKEGWNIIIKDYLYNLITNNETHFNF